MSVPTDFSPVTKILTQSGYAKLPQIEQAIAQFQEAEKNLTDQGSSFIEIIESITGQQMPKHIKQNSLLCLNFAYENYQEFVEIKQDPDILDILSFPEAVELEPSAPENFQIIGLVSKILAKAVQHKVSDIHIEPLKDSLRIRFRRDGILYQAFDFLPKKLSSGITSRIKIMANLDVRERRISQTGKIQRNFQGNPCYFKVSTLPSRYGEKLVLRFFHEEQPQLNLAELITDQAILATVNKLANATSGLILVTGSTEANLKTLYTILAERNNPNINIITVENPIKYSLPGITQIQVLSEKGTDFVSILPSLMEQDPDLIMISEIENQEIAKIAIELARRDCLVLAGFQANDTASAITHLAKMGVEGYQISKVLKGVIAQHLMRRVCECRLAYTPSNAEFARFDLSPSLAQDTFYKAKTLKNEEIATAKKTDTLCPQCHGAGYKGYIGSYEVMPVSNLIEALIIESASYQQIKDAAITEGMTTLLTYSLNLVQQGYSTLEKVERLICKNSVMEAEFKAKNASSLTSDSFEVKVEEGLPNSEQRLQELENQLKAIIGQFKQLKKELNKQ